MGVLDARYKSENVWYSFIWEKAKEDPNVIDYNINEEITKDTSAVFNANNDTTTGMANVIPWVNAPKLIEDTSIIGSGTDFCQISIWATGTLPAWDFTYFDNLSITTSCPSVKLEDNKTNIRFAPWIYIIYVFIRIHKWSATFTISWHYNYPNWLFDRLIASNWDGDYYNMFCAILNADWTWYLRLWINPTLAVSDLSESFIRIAKIW